MIEGSRQSGRWVVSDDECANALRRQEGKYACRTLICCFPLGGRLGEPVTICLPGSLGPGGIRLIRKVLVKDDAVGRKPIQIRRLDPVIAITADIAEV